MKSIRSFSILLRGSDLTHEVRLGVLGHDVDGLWSQSSVEDGLDFNAEVIFRRPDFYFLSGIIRPNIGLSVNDHGDTSKVYAGFLWEFQMQSGMFINLGVGGALHDGELKIKKDAKKGLGSRVLFRIPIEIGYLFNKRSRLSIAFDHISNTYLAEPNEGMDSLGIRYSILF